MKILLAFIIAFMLPSTFSQAKEVQILWEKSEHEVSGVFYQWDFGFAKTNPEIAAYLSYNRVHLIRSQTGDEISVFEPEYYPQDEVISLTFSPTEDILATCTKKGYVYILNINTGELLENIYIDAGAGAMEFTHSGDYLIAAADSLVFIRTDDWEIERKWLGLQYWQAKPPEYVPAEPLEIDIRHDDKVIAGKFRGLSGVYFYDVEGDSIINHVVPGSHCAFFNTKNEFIVFNHPLIRYNNNYNVIDTLPYKSSIYQISDDDKYLYTGYNNINKFFIAEYGSWNQIVEFKGSGTDFKVSADNKYLLDLGRRMYDISQITGVSDPEEENKLFNTSYSETTGVVNIEIKQEIIEPVHIFITDIQGSTIDEIHNGLLTTNEIKYGSHHLSPGTYFITIQGKNINESVKFMIMK